MVKLVQQFIVSFAPFLFFGILLLIALYPSISHGATFTRTPSGYTVDANLSGDTEAEVLLLSEASTSTDPAFEGWEAEGVESWGLVIYDGTTLIKGGNCTAWIPDQYTDGFNFTLPIGEYEYWGIMGYSDDSCVTDAIIYVAEEDVSGVIFEVVDLASSYVRTPSGYTVETNILDFSFTVETEEQLGFSDPEIEYWAIEVVDADSVTAFHTECTPVGTLNNDGQSQLTLPVSSYYFVGVVGYAENDCSGVPDQYGVDLEFNGGENIFEIVSEGGDPNDLGGMIENANVQFEATTGFNVPMVGAWAGENLIKLFIGSILAIIYGLRYWIVALVIIGAIVYFAYRAFRFFKH